MRGRSARRPARPEPPAVAARKQPARPPCAPSRDGEALRTLAGLAGASAAKPQPSSELRRNAWRNSSTRGRSISTASALRRATPPPCWRCAAGRASIAAIPRALPQAPRPVRRSAMDRNAGHRRLIQPVEAARGAAHRRSAALKQLLKQARDRDKNVYKIIKQKCDACARWSATTRRCADDILAACASLERHAHRVYDPIYEPTFRHFHERWQSLEERAAPEISDRARLAVDRCREIHGLARSAARRAGGAGLAPGGIAGSPQEGSRADRRPRIGVASKRPPPKRRKRPGCASGGASPRRSSRRRAPRATPDRRSCRKSPERAARRPYGAGRRIAPGHRGEAAAPCGRARSSGGTGARARCGSSTSSSNGKDYAVAPKRAELIAEMESLIGSSEPPPGPGRPDQSAEGGLENHQQKGVIR